MCACKWNVVCFWLNHSQTVFRSFYFPLLVFQKPFSLLFLCSRLLILSVAFWRNEWTKCLNVTSFLLCRRKCFYSIAENEAIARMRERARRNDSEQWKEIKLEFIHVEWRMFIAHVRNCVILPFCAVSLSYTQTANTRTDAILWIARKFLNHHFKWFHSK